MLSNSPSRARSKSHSIVEDDFCLSTDLETVLRASGANVAAAFPEEDSALEWLHTCTHRPDAALVDINLGSGPSFRVARALRAKNVPFIFITGYEPTIIPAEFNAEIRLQKPIELMTVARAVSQLLASQRAA
jgi:DNA-binding response OmpR family regulator